VFLAAFDDPNRARMSGNGKGEDDDDPFGMFGDDDEGSADEPAAPIPSRGLMNPNGRQGDQSHVCTTAASHPANLASTADASGAESFAAVAVAAAADEYDSSKAPGRSDDHHPPVSLPWQGPWYLCSDVRLASLESVGGGRGYVAHLAATTNGALLPAGTLVMLEEPMLEWPRQQIGRELGLVSVRHVVDHVDATRLHELEHLHPTKAAVDSTREDDNDKTKNVIGDGDGGEFEEQVVRMMRFLRERHSDDLQLHDIVRVAKNRGLVNSDGTPLDTADSLRLLLALRYNGLQSGIYLHVAMLNHSDQPNCVKFMPESGRGQLCSEVRTTRPVRHGEALTIRYLPSIRSHATRRHDLWEQHRFDMGEKVPTDLHEMELVHGEIPPSSRDRPENNAERVTTQVEAATDELQQLYQDMRESFPSASMQLPTPLNISDDAETQDGAINNEALAVIEQIRMLESASDELVSSAGERLGNGRHMLLVPCLELHLDCASLVLQHDATLKAAHRTQLLGRTVRTAMRLVELQTALHGRDHYDLARSHLDLANSIEELLSRSPKTLFALGQGDGADGEFPANSTRPPLTTVAAWSAREHQARKEHHRIKDLYPRDVDKYMA
jgi:hypothetical protein